MDIFREVLKVVKKKVVLDLVEVFYGAQPPRRRVIIIVTRQDRRYRFFFSVTNRIRKFKRYY